MGGVQRAIVGTICLAALGACSPCTESPQPLANPTPAPAPPEKPEPVFPPHEAPPDRETEPEVAEPEVEVVLREVPDFRPNGPRITLACGRATARLPAGFTFGEWVEPCRDESYLQEMDAGGIGGGTSVHTIVGHGCELSIGASDRIPRAAAPPPVPGVHGDELLHLTPEGTAFELDADSEDPACTRFPEPLVRVLSETLRVRPLRSARTETRAQISSAGHGIALDVPVGFWVYCVGGAADEFETSWALHGPEGTRATLYTSWDPESDSSAPMRGFEPRVISDAGRLSPGGYDPYGDGEEECRTIGTLGPEPRIVTSLLFCGPTDGDAALLDILRAARFTRPPPRD